MQNPGGAVSARFRLAGLFVLVTVGFALYRHVPGYIWNDSHGAFTRAEWAQQVSLEKIFTRPFAATGGDGYRPLSHVFYGCGLRFLYTPDGPRFLHLLLIGGIYGALAVSLFCVARRFVQYDATAYFAILLALASPALAATSWVFLAGVQALVPLLICVALLCYWRARENRAPWFHLAVLGAIFLFGPWYREFLGIVPILIVFLECQRARKPTPLMAFAALGLLHAVFPTALIKLLFFPDLPLKSVFALGNLGRALGGSFRWHAAAHFLPQFPPLLWVLATVALFLPPERASVPARSASEGGPRWRFELRQRWVSGTWLVVVLALLVCGVPGGFLPLVLCLGLAVIGLQQDPLLPFWFLTSFVPILRVFTEHIHFLYAVIPAAIILARAAEALWLRAVALRGRVAWVRPALAACLALVAADQAAVLYGVFRVNRATYGGIEEVARWLTHHIPPGSAVVSNVIHGEEIKWHAGGYFENFWTVEAGVPDPRRVVEEPAQLRALLARSVGKNVYYLDVDFDHLPEKANYHRHKYIHQLKVPREYLGLVHRTGGRYFFLDPLRHLIPRAYVPFLGAPDLVDDFYCGRSHTNRLFIYKVSATYRLYRAAGD